MSCPADRLTDRTIIFSAREQIIFSIMFDSDDPFRRKDLNIISDAPENNERN